ncbi:proton-conducting transporter transmembrane domain-containing protein [Rahnella victoriana]|uniref:proton-conducting transporter transmembrane domain-containing protein n=1 Tax=Rahnella victoriana TaxID=1510570 RepID=UPI001E2E7CF4|nr:proton-conducting transporter membrane subunit [Rahnella victoriana]UHM89362.1 proton-conducting membrane transporter [Rahnella victoriana]
MTALFTLEPASLLALALLVWLLSGIAGGLLAAAARISGLISGTGGMVASAAVIVAAVQVLISGTSVTLTLPVVPYTAELSPLNALLLLAMSVTALFSSLYACAWLAHARQRQRARTGLLCNLLLAALTAAAISATAVELILMMEMAALCAYFLIVQTDDVKSRRAGLNQFLSGRLGTLCLILAFALLHHTSGSVSFDVLRHTAFTPGIKSVSFLLALAGFGLYAGIIPLHAWVPQSHSSAPAHAAALFSSALMKIGILGIVKVGLDLLGAPPLWWGLMVLLLAILTAFIGGLYALMEHDIRRLLAYHTLENVGIILLGVGGAMAGVALNLPVLASLALLAGLFHLFNHGLFKTALFLGAGEIEMQTGIKDMEKLGGIARLMPWTAFTLLIALMSMAALPPLNGFASEWLLYQSLFQLSASPLFIARLLGPLLAVGLALTGALALMCIAKVFGVTFLGSPRSQAAEATPAPLAMTLSGVLLALLCVGCGVASPWIIPHFSAVAASVLNAPVLQVAQHGVVFSTTSAVSAPMVAILLLGMPLLPWIIAAVLRGKRLPNRSRGDAWACGYAHSADMVVTATGFAQPLRVMFAPLYRLRQRVTPSSMVGALHRGWTGAFCRRLAFIELAVLLVVAFA